MTKEIDSVDDILSNYPSAGTIQIRFAGRLSSSQHMAPRSDHLYHITKYFCFQII